MRGRASRDIIDNAKCLFFVATQSQLLCRVQGNGFRGHFEFVFENALKIWRQKVLVGKTIFWKF